MNRKERLEQFDDICNTIYKDDELIVKVLCEMFGNAQGLWDVVHTHITGLYEERDLLDDDVDREVENVVYAFREIMDQIVEEEILND